MMSKEHKLKDDEEMKTNLDPALIREDQSKGASVTSMKATMLEDLPMELLEHILFDTIISEVKDRKILRSAWTKSGDRVVERLRNVCSQWDNVLTTSSFRSRLHGIIDSFPPVKICFSVLSKSQFSHSVTVTTMNDEVYVLCRQPQRQAAIEIYAHNDLQTVKRSIQLPSVTMPWDLVACSVNNCLYVLHQASHEIAVLRVSKKGQKYKVSHFITCSNQLVGRMCVAGDGRLVLFQGPVPSKIKVYKADGSLEHQIQLVKPISYLHTIIPKSNGNLVLMEKTTLTEFDRQGNTLYDYKKPSGEYLYGAIDQYDRIVVIDESGDVRLVDSEFNSVKIKFQLDCYQHSNIQFYRVSYNRKWNEFVAFETAAFCDGDAIQCLTVLNFTEGNVPNDTQNKEKRK